MIEGSSLEDQAKEQVVQVMRFAVELCVYEGRNSGEIFKQVHKAVIDAKVEDERGLEQKQYDLNNIKKSLSKASKLKDKSEGDLYQEAVSRIEETINSKIDQLKQEILLTRGRIKLKSAMIEILEKDYPKEPESKSEKMPDYYRDKRIMNDTSDRLRYSNHPFL